MRPPSGCSFGVLLLEMYYGQRAWLGYSPIHILNKATAGEAMGCPGTCHWTCRWLPAQRMVPHVSPPLSPCHPADPPAGEVPFEVPLAAPPALASLMRRCIDVDPAERPSFADILDTLTECAAGLSRPGTPAP